MKEKKREIPLEGQADVVSMMRVSETLLYIRTDATM